MSVTSLRLGLAASDMLGYFGCLSWSVLLLLLLLATVALASFLSGLLLLFSGLLLLLLCCAFRQNLAFFVYLEVCGH
jgi:hypothetical protein